MSRRDEWIGLRVARWRDIAGLTQQQLAERAEISREHLSRVENGRRPVTDRRLLHALAAALGVELADLLDQPTRPHSAHDMTVYAALPALRGALDDPPPDDHPLDLPRLEREVDTVMAARMACDYSTLAQLLPHVVAETRRLADAGNAESQRGLELFVRVAVCAALAIKPFGYVDLAARFNERGAVAANTLGSPVEKAAVTFANAQCALASGTIGGRRRSLRTAVHAADMLGDTGGDDSLTWYVMSHLHAGLSAAVLGDSVEAEAHHGEAAATAQRIESDPWRMEPSPANVAVWRVAISLEDQPEQAPVLARQVHQQALRTRQRQAHLHIQAGRGAYAAGDSKSAIRHFLDADGIAPSELRSRPSVCELVGQMVRDARRRGSTELRDLAVRVGVNPVDPDSSA